MATIVSSGTKTITSGQTQTYYVEGSGVVLVKNGGTNLNGTICRGGKEIVSAYGMDSGALVFSYGSIYVEEFGKLYDASIYNSGYVSATGGTVYSTTILQSGSLEVWGWSSGGSKCAGIADTITLSSGGIMVVGGNAHANSVTVCSGFVYVSSGATFRSSIIGNGTGSAMAAQVYLKPGTVASSNTVSANGFMLVSSNGTATLTTVRSGGSFLANAGAQITSTFVSGGKVTIKAGVTATQTTMTDGDLTVGGESISGTYSGGRVTIAGGSSLNEKVLGGAMYISASGTYSALASNLTVQSASAYVYGSTFVNGVTVSAGGKLYANQGASVGSVDVKTSGSAIVYSGAYVSGGSIYGAETIKSGGSAAGINVLLLGNLEVYGTAESCTVASGGIVAVSSGGLFRHAVMAAGAKITVGSNAVASIDQTSGLSASISGGDLYLNAGSARYADLKKGGLNISSGASISSAFVSAGLMTLFSYGSAGSVDVYAGSSAADVVVWSKAHVTSASVYGSSATVEVNNGGSVSALDLVSGATADVFGRVSSAYLASEGGIAVSSGGSVTNAVLTDSAYLAIRSNGKASSIIASSGANVTVGNGGSGMNATIGISGQMLVLYGGKATGITVSRGGDLYVFSGGFANSVELQGLCSMTVLGSAQGIRIDYGRIAVSSGGIVSGLAISGGGSAVCLDGGRMGGSVGLSGHAVFAGGTTDGLTVSSGGRVSITKQLAMNSGKIWLSENTMFDFDISSFTISAPSADPLFVGYDTYIANPKNTSYTITVSSVQKEATYVLASGASTYNSTLTVLRLGERVGTLELGQTKKIDDKNYTLSLDNDANLTVTVATPTPSGEAKSDIDGNGISDVLFQYTGGDYQLGFWMNGTSEWRGNGLPHPAEWEVLGSYDMNGNSMADAVLVGNVVVNDVKGAYIGYYLDSDDNNANWMNIGYLNNADDYNWKNKVGNLTGNDGANSIVWHTSDLGALGVWTDGTDNWVSLGGGYDASWTMIGCGDFDGDGADSVVMCYNGGEKYYAVNLDGTASELATSDSGWTIRAIGDFSGDGKDDIVAFHKETGLLAMWGDGNSSNWSQLGQLDAKYWFVVGAGDYNGDGSDDLLVRENSSGMLGYYSGADTSNWNVLGFGVDMSWTVIA